MTPAQGYENKLAEALARDLGRKVEYTYFPQRTGFVRQTLRSQDDKTQPVQVRRDHRRAEGLRAHGDDAALHALGLCGSSRPSRAEFSKLTSADDLLDTAAGDAVEAALRHLRSLAGDGLAAEERTHRAGACLSRAERRSRASIPPTSSSGICEAGNIDVALVWGPVAGFLADRHKGEQGWISVPFKPATDIQFDYEMAMGVRFGEKEWKDTLDKWIATHGDDIRTILTSYRVPLLETFRDQGVLGRRREAARGALSSAARYEVFVAPSSFSSGNRTVNCEPLFSPPLLAETDAAMQLARAPSPTRGRGRARCSCACKRWRLG